MLARPDLSRDPRGEAFDFEALRAAEFARLDDANIAYLDFAASALYGASQVTAYAELLSRSVFGNPHSEHVPSRASAEALDAARAATLSFFDADPAIYEVSFTANTTAALKLVAESYPFSTQRGFLYSADNHNSVVGMREFAKRAGAPVSVLPLTDELRLDDPGNCLIELTRRGGAGLLAFPQQSNFSGVQHDLRLIEDAQAVGCDVLIDAAGAGACGGLSLRRHQAEFVACSFYKLFGLPTGVGALIAKKTSLARLRRPWFSGGVVQFVSIAHDRHALRAGHEGWEDGTPNFLDLAAVQAGFEFLARIPRDALTQRMESLTRYFLDAIAQRRHPNGAPLVRLYGPRDTAARGGVVAFNVLHDDGRAVPYTDVEQRARDYGLAIRGGCFCNPGAAEKAFGFEQSGVVQCLSKLEGRFSIPAFQACVGDDVTVGALRLSVGAPTSLKDVERAFALVEAYCAIGGEGR